MSDLVTSRIFTDGERGITSTKMNDIIGSSVIQPAFYTSKSTASSLAPTDTMLALKSGSYVQAPFQTVIDSVSAGLASGDSEIWSVRQRSFNAIGNPGFEVDQRNAGTALTNPASVTFAQDRWQVQRSALTGTVNTQQISVPASPIVWPGTSFAITRSYLRCTVGTAQASLAAGDFFAINQFVEGPRWRELSLDVHSVSLLVRSSVAGLVFNLYLRDPSGARSLTKLCPIPSVNTWTPLSYPNLPIWAAGGTWTSSPGSLGYTLGIGLAAGTTLTAPANDTWQNGNFVGAPGQSNFLATAGATFDIAFIQHEPGNKCSNPPMDCPWQQAYDEGLRYYQKSINYSVVPGSAGQGMIYFLTYSGFTSSANGIAPFKKPMAKVPTPTIYALGGAANNVFDATASTNRAVSGVSVTENFISQISMGTAATAGAQIQFNYSVDTGW